MARLTLDEKADLMRNNSKGVPRLGIPKYDWWNEALHGVARAGEATVFPQVIGLAAMWDETRMRTVADTISTEARAKFNDALRTGRAGERYRGLTFWSPNINLFRDPRWGRGQETYGEDPFLTARMGVAFVRGLQGDAPDRLKVAACAKHLAVHSGPEATRYQVNVEPPLADLHETYLPAFEALVREGRVESVMTAYNALYGTPASVNPLLFGLLREWGFDGHVVCDCGAVYCLYEKYGIARDFPEAEALAVKAGLSLRCGDGDAQLAVAVRRGLLTEAELDARLEPLLRTRFRLGMFDPVGSGPFDAIPLSENDSPAHRAIALDAARASIVLLQNDGTLPLDRSQLRRVLVVGPNADSVPALLGNYHGTPSAPVTVLAGLRAGLGAGVAVDYAFGCDYAESRAATAVIPRTALTSSCDCPEPEDDTSGLQAAFFGDASLAGEPRVRRRDHQIEFAWNGQTPAAGVPADDFSARWTGTLRPGLGGDYRFAVRACGGVRLWLDGEMLLDAWDAGPGEHTHVATRRFADGVAPKLRLDYRHAAAQSPASISLQWTPPAADSGFAATVEKARAADAVIFVGGIYAQLEGEDMRVDYEGFAGGDRTRIELPAIQQRLLAALAATGRPLVFVNLSGSAIAWPEIGPKLNAVVQAWYPGQAGGTAVADILLGNANPAGRLPVTFYRATEDLPAFEDYRMTNRTYRYFKGQPLYPFGHGLSYTRFDYANLKVTRTADGKFSASVEVTNAGERDGDEVVQFYLQEPAATQPRANQSLGGFRRIHLARGEKQTVTFTLTPEILRRWNTVRNTFSVPAGDWRIRVGASSADIRQTATARID